ncbi:hypothetical protein K9N68_08805 [Kovacikia minuta CCNUW1]|uniref:hypothetical protein n=1 Tax=Kovacikia minuta TaxID=2931930 RepID=UPI001CCA4D56|nr:hypothetical protein [Kovacikia minuta]UBF27977.1 hypothetical protein K9N68_08805 [Kovacikia minuta CCNUW1]
MINKLAIVTSHPIQYYAPWFRFISDTTEIETKVFYLWDFGITQKVDAGFKQALQWDIPLLDGYDYEFVPNVSQGSWNASLLGLAKPVAGFPG